MPPSHSLVNFDDEEDRLTPQIRQTLPPWLLNFADHVEERIWDMPHGELTMAAKEILENELGKGQSALRVRMAFWNEFERAQGTREGFVLYHVIGALCSVPRFRKLLEAHPTLTAWLLTPPNSYNVRLLELSMLGEERMREILSAEPIHADGKVDSRLAMVQVKLWEILQDRIHGAVMQRVEQKNLNLNAELNPAQASIASGEVAGMSLDEINDRLNAIQSKIKMLTSPAPIRVDVIAENTKK